MATITISRVIGCLLSMNIGGGEEKLSCAEALVQDDLWRSVLAFPHLRGCVFALPSLSLAHTFAAANPAVCQHFLDGDCASGVGKR